MLQGLLPVSFLLLITACAATPTADTANVPASTVEEHAFTWVWILTGPRDAEVAGDARGEAFAGHFANMARMAEEGDLLVAGPFGEPRVRRDHRGVFVIAESDVDRASEIAATDPTTVAGIFELEFEPFVTTDPMELLMPRHERAVAASGQSDPPPGFHARSYVLVAAAPSRAAERDLSGLPVLFDGRLGDGAHARRLACLDATTADEVHAMLADTDVEWSVMPWYATEEVASLREP